MTKSLKNCRVLVTPTSYGKNDSALQTQLEETVGEAVYNTTGRPLTEAELRNMVPRMDGYIAGLDDITRTVIEAADRLKVIARYGVGTESVDLQAAREHGIIVTNTPSANSGSVAELTLALMLSLARHIPSAIQSTKFGGWPRLPGLSLEGKMVGLIGFGSIGQNVARRLMGFDCKVVAFDPAADSEKANQFHVTLLPFAEVISQADFLSLHCSVTDKTRGMVNVKFLEQMKPGAFLINTARGELIDETALFEVLKTGKLNGAALDVYSKQPPGADNLLLGLPQVLTTPHMGAHTDGAMNAMGWGALNDCLAVLRGDEPANRVV